MKSKLVVGMVLVALGLMVTSGCLLLKNSKEVAPDTNVVAVVADDAQPAVTPAVVAPVEQTTVVAVEKKSWLKAWKKARAEKKAAKKAAKEAKDAEKVASEKPVVEPVAEPVVEKPVAK